jgi:ribosome-associated heat shock protein Hsp15
MIDNEPVRIDKFLWAVRIFKTRSLAASACRMGRVLIDNKQVKPSRIIYADEILIVRKPPVSYTFRVKEPVGNRMSAKITSGFIEDLTPEDEKHKLEIHNRSYVDYRKKGSGRPTKKERRLIDRWKER